GDRARRVDAGGRHATYHSQMRFDEAAARNGSPGINASGLAARGHASRRGRGRELPVNLVDRFARVRADVGFQAFAQRLRVDGRGRPDEYDAAIVVDHDRGHTDLDARLGEKLRRGAVE